MKSDLYRAYSISGRHGVFLWCAVGRKHSVNMYRFMTPDYDLLEGDEKMLAEDNVDFLFTRSDICSLLEYLSRHEKFGDRHVFSPAEDPIFQQLRWRTRQLFCSTFDLDDDWIYPFEIFGFNLPSRDLVLN